ncbi:MAG: winged helix-turn-helix domain-containing protein [Candidatus Brocadiia bacterium]
MPPLDPHPDDAAFLEELTEVAFQVAARLSLPLSVVEHKRRPHPGGRTGLCYYWEGRVSLVLRYREGGEWWTHPREREDVWCVLAHELAHLKDRLHGEAFKKWQDRCRIAVARALSARGGWSGAVHRLIDSFTERVEAMKQADVEIGEVYAVKVSGNICPVVIDEEHPNGGWVGTNQETNRQVRIKTAGRLRMPWDEYLDQGDGDEADTTPESTEEATGEPDAEKPKKRATRAKTGDEGAKMSGLDAAAKVLEEADEPLRCKEIARRALEAGYWASDGKTPHATIYSAILRDMQKKGDESRFRKAGRGLFALAE